MSARSLTSHPPRDSKISRRHGMPHSAQKAFPHLSVHESATHNHNSREEADCGERRQFGPGSTSACLKEGTLFGAQLGLGVHELVPRGRPSFTQTPRLPHNSAFSPATRKDHNATCIVCQRAAEKATAAACGHVGCEAVCARIPFVASSDHIIYSSAFTKASGPGQLVPPVGGLVTCRIFGQSISNTYLLKG